MRHKPHLRTACVLAVPLALLLAACGDQVAGDRALPGPGSTAPVAPQVSAPEPSAGSGVSGGAAAGPAQDAPAAVGTGEVVDWDPTGPLFGTWRGTWRFHGGAVEGDVRLSLRHYDESFNGTVQMSPDVGAVCGKTSGTIVFGVQFDDYVTFGFYDIYGYGFTFHGTLRGGTLSGDFNAINPCGARMGSFEVTL